MPLEIPVQESSIEAQESQGAQMDSTDAQRAPKKFRKRNLIYLLLCWLMWGGGFFIVSLPSALKDSRLGYFNETNNWVVVGFPYSVGRCIGNIIAIQFFTKGGLVGSFKDMSIQNFPDKKLTLRNTIIIFSPLIGSIGFIFYDQMLLYGGNISILSSATSLYVAIPVILGFIFFKEKVTLKKIIGILIAIIAILLLSFSDAKTEVNINGSQIYLFIGVIFSWGIGLFITSISGKVLLWHQTLIMFFCGYILNIIIEIILLTAYSKWSSIATYSTLIKLSGNIISAGGITMYVKLTSENESAQWVALTSLYAIVPIILGFIVFNYPINAMAGCGIVLSLIAVLFLQ